MKLNYSFYVTLNCGIISYCIEQYFSGLNFKITSLHGLFELNCCMLCRCLRYIANTSLGQYFITIVYFKVGFLEMHSRMLVVGFCRRRETFPSSICFIIEAILSNFLKLCPPLLGENLLPLVTPPWHLRVQL